MEYGWGATEICGLAPPFNLEQIVETEELIASPPSLVSPRFRGQVSGQFETSVLHTCEAASLRIRSGVTGGYKTVQCSQTHLSLKEVLKMGYNIKGPTLLLLA
jgi:hypothetical protein